LLLHAWRPWAAGSPAAALRDAVSARPRPRRASLWPAALAALVLLGVVRLAAYPSWDARLMQTALYRWERHFDFPTFESFRQARARDKFLWSRDGAGASVAVEDRKIDRILRVNGKPDASTGADLLAQLTV